MKARCMLCGHPMPPGEESLKYHGFSGRCPQPPVPTIKQDCPSCDGEGRTYHSRYGGNDPDVWTKTCVECEGTGKIRVFKGDNDDD